MNFPLSFADASLWLAVTSITVFISTELIMTYYRERPSPIDKKRLRNVALITAVLFLIIVAIRVYSALTRT